MYSSKILLMVFIIFTVFWGTVNTSKIIYRDSVPAMNFVFSLSVWLE